MCGNCCRHVQESINLLPEINRKFNLSLTFPYKVVNGVCEMLGDDNRCKVYHSRPIMCNIDEFITACGIDKEQAYSINIKECNNHR